MVTGGLDYRMKIWDFTTMNRNLKPFRDFKPFDGHPVRTLSFNPSGTHFLCCCGNNQAKIYNSEGVRKKTTIRGDMYLLDMANTKGHVASVNDGQWHPKENNLFITGSQDGTIRQWDMYSKEVGVEQQLAHQTLMKAKGVRGAKIAISTSQYSHKGEMVYGGCSDGSIQIWDLRGNNLYRPQYHFADAHRPGGEITAIQMFRDSYRFATRSMDDTMKMWDIRKPTEAVFTWEELVNLSSKTAITISPNEKMLLTGTSVRQGYGFGFITGFSTVNGEKLCEIPISKTSVIALTWHHQLNQIFVGSADAKITVLYDPELSQNGAMRSITRQEKRKVSESAHSGYFNGSNVYNHSELEDELLKVREDRAKNGGQNPKKPENDSIFIPPEAYDPMRRRERKLREAKKVSKPELPLQGPSKGGRTPQSGTLAQYVMQDLYKNVQRDMDPREALLAQAKAAESMPLWVEPAYTATQPTRVFDYKESKQDNVRFMQNVGKDACKHCGLKLCTCEQQTN